MSRESIKLALFNLIGAIEFSTGSGSTGFKTISTKLKHWDDVDRSQQPAFFLSQGPQIPHAPVAPGAPRSWHLDYTARIYVNTEGATDPASVLNPILDAIVALFDPETLGGPQTLGGLVQWARIEGQIDTFEGTLGDQEVALIPVRCLATAITSSPSNGTLSPAGMPGTGMPMSLRV